MNKTTTYLVAGAAAILLICFAVVSANHTEKVIDEGLPPLESFSTQAKALDAASAYRDLHGGGDIYPIAGTGSMAPWLPAAKPGQDPLNTIVGYVITDPKLTFADISPANHRGLVIYDPKGDTQLQPTNGRFVMHSVVLKDGEGWIPSGKHNNESENRFRVRPDNLQAIVVYAVTWPQ